MYDDPMPDEQLAAIRDRESRNLGMIFDSTVTELLAEVDRLRVQVAQYERSADEHTAKFDRKHETLISAQSEIDRLRAELVEVTGERNRARLAGAELIAELKAAKSTRFENNGAMGAAAHIQAETVNDLRLN